MTIPWIHSKLSYISGNKGYIRSTDGAIFSLNKNVVARSTKAPQYSIYSNKNYGPTFGSHDLYIPNKCNVNNGHSNLGSAYATKSLYTYGSNAAKSLLAGSYYFRTDEYEVYYYSK